MCTSQNAFQQEVDHIRQALLECNFPPWTLNNLQTKFHHRLHTDHTHGNNTQQNNNSATTNSCTIFLVVPYSKGLNEIFSKTCRSLGIQVHFKGSKTINNLSVATKDKESTTQKSGVIYGYKCTQADCDEEYIRELGRIFSDRLKEYLRDPSPSTNTVRPWDIALVWAVSP